ncbi:MAG: ATP-dependent RecD-like DNA helicase, partial [Lentisphaeria bacterium]|nr:ATP-dependent RecD-like DNA helicase [Lentisphaeria bacterium]
MPTVIEDRSMPDSPTILKGELLRFRYRDDSGNFSVAVIRTASGEEVVCGPMPGAEPGRQVELEGVFATHQEYGREFRISKCKSSMPESPSGLIRFLSSAVPGLGPKHATAIVEHFGKETMDILNRFPRRLKEVPGIGSKRAADINRFWKESASQRESLIFLQGLGITPAYCAKLLKSYGNTAPDVIRKNPWRLADEVSGIGFLKADEIARALQIPENSPERLRAAAVYAMNSLISYGHVCSPPEDVIRAAASLLKVNEDMAKTGLDEAIEKKQLLFMDDMIYTPALAEAELTLAERIMKLASVTKFAAQKMGSPDRQTASRLAPEQLKAVECVKASPLSIVTGGPGVGKTTVMGKIVELAGQAKLRILLAAPTGRAAKRLSESSGIEAKTIHRLLGYDPARNKFEYDSENPLSCDLLIVDEVSMLDLPLATALFAAIPAGCATVLVGDADQLPPVGPGTVLADLANSGFFTVTHLTQVFRQAAESSIIFNAHRVLRGEIPIPPAPEKNGTADFYWIDPGDDPGRAEELIEKMVAERIPQRFGFDPVKDIQLLTPMNRGDAGVFRLNPILGKRLLGDMPESFNFGERLFRRGDKIMQRSNNYDKNVFNGDVGFVDSIDQEERKFTCAFDNGDHCVEYSFDEADQLSHAYAVTVHKSQGGEYPCVILPLLKCHYMML